MFQARQGSVFIRQVPIRARAGTLISDRGRVVLAVGAASGLAHEVIAANDHAERPAAQLLEEPDGQRYLVVDRACVLTHKEHAPIAVAPGCYRVTIQREYEPEGIGHVLD